MRLHSTRPPSRKILLTLAVVLSLTAPAPAVFAAGADPSSAGTATTPAAETVVDVTAFGADPTGRRDSAGAVAKAMRQAKRVKGPVRVLFPRGTYQLYPEHAERRELYVSNTVGADQTYRDKRIGILAEDMRDVTIDGDGSHLLFHGLMTTFAVIRSHDVKDVLISRNTFLRPAGPVILVEPTNQVVDPARPVHHNIRVRDNTFRTGDVRLLDAKSVSGISFERNTVSRLDRDTAFAAETADPCPAPGATTQVRAVPKASAYTTSLFAYRGSSDAVIEDNRFDNGLNLRADLNATDAAEVTGDEVALDADNILPLLPSTRWTSGDPAVATVDRSGRVTAKRVGGTTITPTTSSRLGPVAGIPVTLTVGADPTSPDCA